MSSAAERSVPGYLQARKRGNSVACRETVPHGSEVMFTALQNVCTTLQFGYLF